MGSFDNDGLPARIRLDDAGVVERNFEVLWNGRIEGKVYDDSGTPARAWVKLLSANGSQIPGYVHFFDKTAEDGSYRFHRIPRNLVVVNPDGPRSELPHNIQFYPSAVLKEKAHVLELANGQRMRGSIFERLFLPSGTLECGLRGRMERQRPAHTSALPTNTPMTMTLPGNCIKETDQNGLATIGTHGGSQVRIFAAKFVNRDDHQLADRLHSQPVQYAADQTPDTVNLVLNSVRR